MSQGSARPVRREGRLERPGAGLRFTEAGAGRPILFQHGLGGDAAQVAEIAPAGRVVTLECRAHGGSQSGPPALLSIASFAADVLALADQLRLERFALGGISMGAAIAVRIAALHPDRIEALALVRPAWLFAPAPENMQAFAVVAKHLREAPPAKAKRRFAASEIARRLASEAPDNLASLLGFFDRPHPETTVELLGRIAADGPDVAAAAVTAPTLVVGNAIDLVHPLALARQLASVVPDARFVEVPAKATDRAAHAAAVRAAIDDHFGPERAS